MTRSTKTLTMMLILAGALMAQAPPQDATEQQYQQYQQYQETMPQAQTPRNGSNLRMAAIPQTTKGKAGKAFRLLHQAGQQATQVTRDLQNRARSSR